MAKAQMVPSRINEVAMLARLNQGMWRAVKTDGKITREVNKKYRIKRNLGVYRKHLIDPKALAPIANISWQAAWEHRNLTLPWLDDGARMLSQMGYFVYTEKMDAMHQEFDKLVAKFYREYPRLRSQAQEDLNDGYDPAQYLTVEQMRPLFYFNVSIGPLPNIEDFRVDLGAAELRKIKQDNKAEMAETLRNANRDIWQRMQEVVGKMVQRLNAYKVTKKGVENKFHDTLVTNIVDVLDLVPLLNITQDPKITAYCDRIRTELVAHSPEVLRDDDKIRKDTARRAQSILDRMQEFAA